MSGERWSRVRQIFEYAVELESQERTDLVEHACGADRTLHSEVRRLLAEYVEDDAFLARPLLGEGAFGHLTLEATRLVSRPTVTNRAARPAIGVASGAVVGSRYRVDGLVCAGGMGEVYRATHTHLDRPVALKLIRPELLDSPEVLEHFEREARVVASLKHPHIVSIHDAGVDPLVGPFLAFELLEGQTLADAIAERGRLPLYLAIDLMRDVCSAVDAVHALGVVHRDLKPGNIFLEAMPGGVVPKVLDFGVATHFGDDAAVRGLTRTGALVGTVAYMAPEQCQGLDVDGRTDVYALGCILYEAVTGRRPFVGASMAVLALKQMFAIVDAPCSVVPNLPVELDSVVARALAKRPCDRFGSAGELAEALLTVPLDARASAAKRRFVAAPYGVYSTAETLGDESTDVRALVPRLLPPPPIPLVGRDGGGAGAALEIENTGSRRNDGGPGRVMPFYEAGIEATRRALEVARGSLGGRTAAVSQGVAGACPR